MNLVNIALSGLNANRVALDVTAQNVANVNTPGYSRQQALMSSVGGAKNDSLSAGMGVQVNSIRRVTDQFLVKQTWTTGSAESYSSRYTNSMSYMENTLGSDGFNLSAGLDNLFAALHDATSKPESLPLRQQIINEAEAISRRFNTLTESLYNQNKDMSDQRTAAVSQANSLMQNIADVNKQIVASKGVGANAAQLMDTRDSLVSELAKLVKVKTTEQSDGSMQVTLSSGQPLVMGSESGVLKSVPDASDAYLATLHVELGKQSFTVAGDVGGELGAINDYQREMLKPYMTALDDMASSMADAFNVELAMGLDLGGLPGKALFTYDAANPASSLTITDISPNELGLSGDGNPGNSDNLTSLIRIANQPFSITGFGSLSLNDAFTGMVGEIAIKARQAESDYQAKTSMNDQAIAARDNISAVNSDEEAANLMSFSNAHNANMKVISTANQLFDSVLQLF